MKNIEIGLVVVFSAMVASCVGTPARVSAMDAAAIQSASEDDLCFTYVWNMQHKQASPNVDAEVKRRGVSCTYRKETMIGDCSSLRILNWGKHPTYSNVTVVNVQNTSNRIKKFGISLGNIASWPNRIGPGETVSFNIVVSKEMGTVAAVTGALQGLGAEPPTLNQCVTDFRAAVTGY